MTISAQMFPLSGLSGSSTDHIDRPRMLQLAKNKRPLSSSQLEQMLNEHLKFLDNSGAGGDWTTLVINGIVLGLYDGFQPDKGKQAHFEHLHLKDHCSLQMQILPFSNCCGLYAKQLQ